MDPVQLTDEKFMATDKEIATAVACVDQLPMFDTKKSNKLRLTRAMLTYKTHIDKEALEAFLCDVLYEKKCGEILFLRIAHETADPAAPYPHTHVVIHVSKEICDQTAGHRIFDWPDGNIHPNIHKIKTNIHLGNAKRYLAKEDPDNADLKEKIDGMARKLLSAESLGQALATSCPKEWTAMIAAFPILKAYFEGVGDVKYNSDEIRKRLDPWQLSLFNMLEEDFQFVWHTRAERAAFREEEYMREKRIAELTRRIIVIYNPDYEIGKTFFCKQLAKHNPNRYFSTGGLSNDKDIACLIADGMKAGWSGKVLLINLPKEQAERMNYGLLEKIRDGLLTSTKYRPEQLNWDIQHICIFTNSMPNIFTMDISRWWVYKVTAPAKGSRDAVLGDTMTTKEIKTILEGHDYVEGYDPNTMVRRPVARG